MEAIILAGGFGTRLRTVVPDLPKPMAPVAGRPFLEILLKNLAQKGFKRVVLSLGYKANVIVSHFGSEYEGLAIEHAVEERPLGTGGAIRLALSHCMNDHAFVFNGDTFLDLECELVQQLWQRNHRPIIVGRTVPDTSRYGRLLTHNGLITGFTEKGINGQGLINAGCYVLNRNQLGTWDLNTPFSLETDFFMPALQNHSTEIDCFETEGLFIDIGIPEDYQRAQALLANYT